jgi:hypothetical protein
MPHDATYAPKVYKANGGDTFCVENGGQLDILPHSLTATTYTLTSAYQNKTLILNRAAGIDVTLPAATGSGLKFRFVVGTALNSDTHTIAASGATDYFKGHILAKTDADATAVTMFITANSGTAATETDKITVNGGTQGGIVGDWIEVEDIATAIWAVSGALTQSGSEATPFSVT